MTQKTLMNKCVMKNNENNDSCQDPLFLMKLLCSLTQTIISIAKLISNGNGDADENDASLGDDDEREVVKSN